MKQGFDKLTELSEQMRADRELGLAPSSPSLTTSEFVSWFGYKASRHLGGWRNPGRVEVPRPTH